MTFASIPSPPISEFSLGPLDITFYGILIATGVAVAAIVTTRRFVAWGGDAELAQRVIVWAVILGFLGARLAYVSTHLERFEGRWIAVFFIWEGGLALFGGLTVGTATAVVMLRRAGVDPWVFADSAAVGIPLAQAIGRWGNYFNQELFGTPTDLPWGLEIDPSRRPAEYAEFETFHPTFLYESLWNALIVAPVILLLERRGILKRGSSIALYMVLYGFMRFLTELIRTDTEFRFLGLSRNGWVSMGVVLAGIAVLVWRQRRGEPQVAVAAAE
ncbi:MAG: prolipoprotein diacylglyceryl transferase [Acidimicrobiia bacterium]